MRVFSGSLAVETNTFEPMPKGLVSFAMCTVGAGGKSSMPTSSN